MRLGYNEQIQQSIQCSMINITEQMNKRMLEQQRDVTVTMTVVWTIKGGKSVKDWALYEQRTIHSVNAAKDVLIATIPSVEKHAFKRTSCRHRYLQVPYLTCTFLGSLDSLSDRRDKLSRTFFQNMCKPASCLHHLPPPRNTSPISRLRSSIPLPRPTSRTKKFQSFVNFAPSIAIA